VEALDFILKPISYFEFSNMMDKVVKTLQQREFDSLIVCTNRETRRIRVAQVAYIEVQRHKLFYHLQDEVLEAWGSLAALEESLPDKMFSRINSGTIVNLNHVLSVREDEVVLSKETLPLSRRRKKEFLSDLAHYFGEERSV
jgi:DNA-binding LytR/AlgR family response regulator